MCFIYICIYIHTHTTHINTYINTQIYINYIFYIYTHTYDTSPYQIYDLQIFSHILLSFHFLDSALFTFLTVSPNLRSSDIFNFEVQIYFLSFVVCAPGDISKNPLPNPRSWRFTLMFPPNSFTLLCKNSSFKSLVHLELIFVCGAKWGPTSFFDFQFWGQGQCPTFSVWHFHFRSWVLGSEGQQAWVSWLVSPGAVGASYSLWHCVPGRTPIPQAGAGLKIGTPTSAIFEGNLALAAGGCCRMINVLSLPGK